MLEELLGLLIVLVVRVVDGILRLIWVLRTGSRTLMEHSRLGDSPMQAELRQWWERFCHRWF
jgi:hypothetical protein